MTEAWFATILYGSCPEPWGGEGSGVSGVAKKESENCMQWWQSPWPVPLSPAGHQYALLNFGYVFKR